MAVVLVIDDDPTFRAWVREVLDPLGVRVVGAEHGAAALKLLSSGSVPELMLTALEMPVMSGWELLDALRANPRLSRVPVILTSGPLDERLMGKALCALPKPISPAALLTCVRTLVIAADRKAPIA